MKDLNVYIEELLYKSQCVIIPRFGAFISNRKSATIADDKSFAPPKRELTFNPSLNSNDGLLVKYVSEQSGIDYNLVEDYINLAVDGWKRILQQNQPLVLDKIGTLQQIGEGRVSFTPADDVNYLTDSFGMTPFIPHEIPNASMQTNEIKPTLNPSHTLPPEEEMPLVESPITQDLTPEVPADKGKKAKKEKSSKGGFKLRPYVKYTAVAAVGLLILAYGAYLFFGEKITKEGGEADNQFVVNDSLVQERLNQKLSEAGVFTPPITMPTVPMPVEKVKVKTSTNATATETKTTTAASSGSTASAGSSNSGSSAGSTASAGSNNSASTAATTNGGKGSSSSNSAMASKKYQVIAGAFKEDKNAQKRVKELHKLGYKSAFVLGTNAKGLVQVSYGGFDTMDEAKALQTEIKNNKEKKKLDGGWILTQ